MSTTTPATRRVALTVSGTIPESLDDDIAAGIRPRADYRVMAEHFDADLIDRTIALQSTGLVGSLLERWLGVGPLLAWWCFRHRRLYDVIVTDGEQVGLPLALLTRLLGRGSARHMMIVHILSTATKSRLIRWARLASQVDTYVVYCSAQRDFLVDELGVGDDAVALSTFMVDTRFFDEDQVAIRPSGRLAAAAGLERRDYPTLMRAVDGIDADIVIAAASPWSTRADSTEGQSVPDNVTINRLELHELRDLYAESSVVVMPLDDVDFQAGITTILEAMAMARPVVCTATPGQNDTLVDGVTGIYVPIGDAQALRREISNLLGDSETGAAMGLNARRWVVENADIDVYASRLATHVRALRTTD